MALRKEGILAGVWVARSVWCFISLGNEKPDRSSQVCTDKIASEKPHSRACSLPLKRPPGPLLEAPIGLGNKISRRPCSPTHRIFYSCISVLTALLYLLHQSPAWPTKTSPKSGSSLCHHYRWGFLEVLGGKDTAIHKQRDKSRWHIKDLITSDSNRSCRVHVLQWLSTFFS